jgi:SAM-dependent methyltransferase
MKYDPIKDRIFSLIRLFPALRRSLYLCLDFLLLRQRYVKREIRRYFRDGDSFYDAGAGLCQYSDYILSRYPRSHVFATDLKTDYMQSYAAFRPRRFAYQTADLVSFRPKNAYSMAIAIDILEHIEDDRAVLTNLHHALKDGGHLIISTPSNLDEAARYTEEHVRPGYDKSELEAKLRDAGFKIISSRFSYGPFGALAWKLQMQIPLDMLSATLFNALVLVLWYPMFIPLMELLMRLDMLKENDHGNGIIIVAQKTS